MIHFYLRFENAAENQPENAHHYKQKFIKKIFRNGGFQHFSVIAANDDASQLKGSLEEEFIKLRLVCDASAHSSIKFEADDKKQAFLNCSLGLNENNATKIAHRPIHLAVNYGPFCKDFDEYHRKVAPYEFTGWTNCILNFVCESEFETIKEFSHYPLKFLPFPGKFV